MEPYEILLDTFMDGPEVEALASACLALTAQDKLGIESGAPVSRRKPDVFKLAFRVKVDSDLRVWFEQADR